MESFTANHVHASPFLPSLTSSSPVASGMHLANGWLWKGWLMRRSYGQPPASSCFKGKSRAPGRDRKQLREIKVLPFIIMHMTILWGEELYCCCNGWETDMKEIMIASNEILFFSALLNHQTQTQVWFSQWKVLGACLFLFLFFTDSYLCEPSFQLGLLSISTSPQNALS